MIRLRLIVVHNASDQIMFCAFSFILSGRPNECWLNTCRACVIQGWRLGLRAPLVTHDEKNNYIIFFKEKADITKGFTEKPAVKKN